MIVIIGGTLDDWGLIPDFLDTDDPRPAREQINENYAHGGGWQAFDKFTFDVENEILTYPGDPPMRKISTMIFRDEQLHMFESAWVVILQQNGSWEAARLD